MSIIKLELNSYEYEAEIIDGTHIKMRMIVPSKNPNWNVYHINQMNDNMLNLIKEQGFINGNFFVTE